jgi:predicted nucleic acid-binding protein
VRFWDSSALVPLIAMETASARVQDLYRKDPQVLAWAFTEIEMLSALCRRHREGRLSAADLQLAVERVGAARRTWHEVRDLLTVRTRARRLLRAHPLRAGDALQLAAALVALREDVEGFEFLTFDGRLREAARAEGFAAPEMA